MEVYIENIQFTKHCVKLTRSLIKWIFVSLRENKMCSCIFLFSLGCIFRSIAANFWVCQATPRNA